MMMLEPTNTFAVLFVVCWFDVLCQVQWPKREWFCALIENLTHLKLEPKVLIVALVTVLTPMDWTQVHMHVLDILYQGDTLWHNTKILLVLSFY